MIKYKDVDFQANRRNYRQANNVNYLDGDRASNLDNWQDEVDEEEEEYGSDEEEVEEEVEEEEGGMSPDDESTNRMYRRVTDNQKENPTSSLVNNKVRVVKGGSWKDRAYYLQAGTRRYYDQNRSSSWIGFRCAMDRLGSRVK